MSSKKENKTWYALYSPSTENLITVLKCSIKDLKADLEKENYDDVYDIESCIVCKIEKLPAYDIILKPVLLVPKKDKNI
jgi:hypothetical protein